MAFGQAFGSLELGEYHIWVKQILSASDWWTFRVHLQRIWANVDIILNPLMVLLFGGMVEAHEKRVAEMIQKRKALGADRPDFLRTILAKKQDGAEVGSYTDHRQYYYQRGNKYVLIETLRKWRPTKSSRMLVSCS